MSRCSPTSPESLQRRFAREAAQLRAEAKSLPRGRARDAMERRASQVEMGWLVTVEQSHEMQERQ